ncbi:MAG: hypothetical protein MRY21_05180 [Simkaniaceae bacterium]|nr:hypothetical protein [Simkaniaceae bacterium]
MVTINKFNLFFVLLFPIWIFSNQPIYEANFLSYFDDLEDQVHSIEEGKFALSQLIYDIEFTSGISIDPKEGIPTAISHVRTSDLPHELKNQLTIVLLALTSNLTPTFINDKSEKEPDIPGGIIIGSIEILAGVLLHLVPHCGWLGKAAIADGLRRGFNSIEKQSEENAKKQTSYFIAPNTTTPYTVNI